MATAPYNVRYNRENFSIVGETVPIGGTYTHRVTLPANQTDGILFISNDDNQLFFNGGIYTFTRDEDDSTGRSTRYIQDQISAGSGTSGSSYNFYYSRPEMFNFAVGGQTGNQSYGPGRTGIILVEKIYIDSATDELVLVFENPSGIAYTLDVTITFTTYNRRVV